MIRINLLPVRKVKKRQSGTKQLTVALVLLGLQLAVLFFIWSGKNAELEAEKTKLRQREEQVNALQKQNTVITDLKKQKESLENMARVLLELDVNRAGPVQVLDEVKRMLNPPATDLKRDEMEKQFGWNTRWDPNRLWLTAFTETGGSLTIKGRAMSNDDIAEFSSRLSRSPYFSGVRWGDVKAVNDPTQGRVYEFTFSATVKYNIIDG